jgi:hypothetical protein
LRKLNAAYAETGAPQQAARGLNQMDEAIRQAAERHQKAGGVGIGEEAMQMLEQRWSQGAAPGAAPSGGGGGGILSGVEER